MSETWLGSRDGSGSLMKDADRNTPSWIHDGIAQITPITVYTKDDCPVLVDCDSRVNGFAREHLAEGMAHVETRGRDFLIETVDFGRRVGGYSVVPVGRSDDVYYARRPGRRYKSPIVRGRHPVSTRNFTMILKRRAETVVDTVLQPPEAEPVKPGYVLRAAWVGPYSPPEPDDVLKWRLAAAKEDVDVDIDREMERSRAFWQSHAFLEQFAFKLRM